MHNGPIKHHLKISPVHYLDVFNGTKKAEVRKHDRDFQVVHVLYLMAYDPILGYLDNSDFQVRITHILKSTEFSGLSEGYSLLSFESYQP